MNQLQSVAQTLRSPIKKLTAGGLAMGLALLVGAAHSYAATNLTWVGGSGAFDTASNWDPAQAPATEDKTLFTNDTTYTVSFSGSSPVMDSNTFSNHAGVATLDIGGNTWTVTNDFYVGKADSTTTVYLASGTLSVAGTANSAAQLRIGDATTNLVACPSCNCEGTLIVTNGTVVVDGAVVGPTNASHGKLVLTGSSTFTFGVSGSTLSIGVGSSGNQLIVTNGGKLFVDGTLTCGSSPAASNNSAIFSGPTSAGTLTSAGQFNFNGDGGQLVVSNGAKLTSTGSLLFGNHSSFNTGVVVGAGSALIFDGSVQIGTGSRGGTNNFFMVSDGGFISADGTFAYGNNGLHVNDGVQIGGTGLMSTGLFVVVRSASNNTNHFGNFVTVTNAFVTSRFLNPQGPEETVSVLGNATWVSTNSLASQSNSNAVYLAGRDDSLIINGGTVINLLTADNGGGVAIGGTAGGNPNPGAQLIVTNGGRLLTSNGTIGNAAPLASAIVVGANSVWSNFSQVAGFTNFIIVGTGAAGSNNFLGVFDGGQLYNNGSLEIGNNGFTAVVNTVRFGSPGLPVFVNNTGSLNIGSDGGSYSNTLTVTNATLTCGALNVGTSGATNNLFEFRGGTVSVTVSNMVVRPTNTVLFTAGTLNAVGMRYDTLANFTSSSVTNPFVVGDGTSAAYYDMAAGGSGYHDFNNGGLVVTNGATLRGQGTLAGKVTCYGTFTPATVGSVGTILTSNSLQFGASSVLNYDLGTSSDSVTVKGSLILGGTINVTSNAGFTATTYTLLTHTNVVSGTLTVGTLPPGYSATVSTNTLPLVQLIVTAAGGGDPYGTWLTNYGLTPGGDGLGTADPDGDGMNNTNEFLAGFNPTNSSARLKITNVARTDGTNVTITYLGASGDSSGSPGPKTNVLESTLGTPAPNYATNNFVSTGQTNVLSGGTGLGTTASFIVTNGATGPARYYRVRVPAP